MTEQQKPIPTPYKYEWDEEYGSFRLYYKDGIWHKTPILIRHKATIAFIVKACNSYNCKEAGEIK